MSTHTIGLHAGLLSLGLLGFVFLKGLNFEMRCMSEFKDRRNSCLLVGLTRITFCAYLSVQKDSEGTSTLTPPLWNSRLWDGFGEGGPFKVASFRQAEYNALNSRCWASARLPWELGSLRSHVGIWTLSPLKTGWGVPSPHPQLGSRPSPPASTVKI